MDTNHLCPNCMNEIKEGSGTCPSCGYDLQAQQETNPHALKPFTILQGKYLVGNVIGEGGFGITYIGFDLNLEMKIAIKEFYPNGFVTRESDVTSMVTGYTTNDPKQYQKWKDSFVREARNLAKFSNLPGIVHVRDFFQENNTAYIIMEYVEGETLKGYLKQRQTPMLVEETLEMMRPVIKSLSKVHEAGIIHRDISPDNIMIQSGGDVKLIDFGAAREFEAGNERSMSVLLKPGYAPEEQYRTRGEQGPWTDVYALCATIYRCITGQKPVESMERIRQDDLALPSALGIAIDPVIENVLMNGMTVYAEKRIRDMNTLYFALYKGEAAITGNTIQGKDQKSGRHEGSTQIEESPRGSDKGRTQSGRTHAENSRSGKKTVGDKNTGTGSKSFGELMANKNVKIGVIAGGSLLVVILIVVIAFNAGRGKANAPAATEPETATAPTIDIKVQENDEPETPDSYPENPQITDQAVAEPEPEPEMPEPLTDEEIYRNKYADIISRAWSDPNYAGWNIMGLQIINLNANDSDVPEAVVIWDMGRSDVIGQSVYGINSQKDSKTITSSTVYDYNLSIYKGDDGSTVAYTLNDAGTTYLIDSNNSKAFSFTLTNDEEFDYSIRDEFVGRVPDVMGRAIETPAGWSPDEAQYYRVYGYERDEVLESILSGKSWVDQGYISCDIPYSESGEQKIADWNEVWAEAWKDYIEHWN